METLNFQENKVQMLDIETLSRTYKENDIYGQPLKGIYHFELLNQIKKAAEDENLKPEIWDLFAAQNASKQAPGVSLLPQVEAVKGQNATEAHILRRVFANIRLRDDETQELTTNLAVAFHQEGIEVAIGEAVIVCHNQTILSPKHIVRSYGKEGKTPSEILTIVAEWMKDSRAIRQENREKIAKMKSVNVSAEMAYQIIGMLTATRVAHDTKHIEIRNSETYPLNQSQISQFTEKLMLRYAKNLTLNLFDVYDCANELYKGDSMDIPQIIPQNLAMSKFLEQFYN